MTEHDTGTDDLNAPDRTAESEIVENLRNFRREAADSAAREVDAGGEGVGNWANPSKITDVSHEEVGTIFGA